MIFAARTKRNLIGPQLQKLRKQHILTRNELAAKCGACGWDIDYKVIEKIEKKERSVDDGELYILAKIFKIKTCDLYPTRVRNSELLHVVNKPNRKIPKGS
ncbi:MAG: helix-turn-helix transcriptional regulator [Verrucomicrobiota bacterium]